MTTRTVLVHIKSKNIRQPNTQPSCGFSQYAAFSTVVKSVKKKENQGLDD